jgi:ABC-2 type transport system ATP-binding protein
VAAAIQVDRISRVFKAGGTSSQALRDVSFEVESGSVAAVLGANGAGKTTLTKILSTLLLPSVGTARVLGHDVVREAKSVRAVTNVIFGGERGLYSRLTGRANLRFFAMLSGVGRRTLSSRVDAILAQVGLVEAADRRVETYSKGMRQRLHIAIGLISRPRVLLLDEPTIGLDPIEAQRLRDSVRELRTEGVTVLLTSHYLLDVEELADQVLLLDRGAIVADVPLAEFVAEAGYAAVVEVRARGMVPDLDRLLRSAVDVEQSKTAEYEWRAILKLRTWDAEVFGELGRLMEAADVVDVQVRPARLEEAYARLSARALQ